MLVRVAPHVHVPGHPVDGKDVAEPVAVPVANVQEFAATFGFEDAAMRSPLRWGLSVPGGSEELVLYWR